MARTPLAAFFNSPIVDNPAKWELDADNPKNF
jgi:hypothetical protein